MHITSYWVRLKPSSSQPVTPPIIFFTVVHSSPRYPARASGLVLSANLSGTLVGPLVVGALAGRGAYPAAWLFVSVCSAVAAVGFVVAARLRDRAFSG